MFIKKVYRGLHRTTVTTTYSDDRCVEPSFFFRSLTPSSTVITTTMKRVNVQVPDEIHTRAKVIAVLKGVTLNEYLELAIREAVDKDKAVLEQLKRK